MNLTCFHCGLPVPNGSDFPVIYDAKERATCCAGCQAVAGTIIKSGLSDYYENRTKEGRKSEVLPADLLQQIRLYDSSELQKSFVHSMDGARREAALMLEGITCAACIWLNEEHIRQLPGVIEVDINYTTHRARITWDDDKVRLSEIMQAIAAIGYLAHPYDPGRQEVLVQKQRKQAISRLWVAGLSMMQVMMYVVPIYVASDGEMELEFYWLLQWANMLLTLPVLLYSATPFYKATWRDLKIGRVGMDTPVTIGVLTAFFGSLWGLIHKEPLGIYFDSVSMFVFLLLGGRYLEGLARRKAGEATEKLIKLIPAFAHRVPGWPNNRETLETTVTDLEAGYVILMKPGETIPVDGVILDGHSQADEAFMTGESRPVDKKAGDSVVAGSINTSSPIYIEVSRVGEDTLLASIVRLLDKALAEKPRLAVVAERFSSWFVALLLFFAASTYIVWHAIEPTQALWITVSVLVISCPCALSLATPAALAATTGHLAELGVLTARSHALETLARVTDVVFDKTGTLTLGQMRLCDEYILGSLNAQSALQIAAALEQAAEHPVAKAIREAASGDITYNLNGLINIPGKGVEGVVDGQRWRLGKPDFVAGMASKACTLPFGWNDGRTIVALGNEEGLQALFAVGDSIRPDAVETIAQLRELGVSVHLLSGDGENAVQTLAQDLRIDSWMAQATPETKLDALTALQQGGRRVLMVGDGINDAPVLGRSDVSLAMGGGTDVARASGDMVLINDNLALIPVAMIQARRTLRVIKQNLWWAVTYNVIALPLAISGHVTPWIASLGMASSSLVVVSNALRLVRRK